MKIIRVDSQQREIEQPEDIEGLIEAWITDLKRTKAPDTVDAYSLSVQRPFRQWLDRNDLNLYEIGPKEIESWLDEMALTVTKATVSIRFFGVKSLYKWMYKNSMIRFDPTYSVELPRSRVQSRAIPREALENEQVLALLATCDNSFEGTRAKAIISLMAYCGLRQIEVFRSELSHFRKRDGRMTLQVHGKGRETPDEDEFVVIPMHQEERINRWLKIRGYGGRALFTYRGKEYRRLSRDRIYDVVKDRLVEIEIQQSPHCLRHTFITRAREGGAGGRQLQLAARHKSFDTTARYIHRDQRLKFPAEDLVDYGEFHD